MKESKVSLLLEKISTAVQSPSFPEISKLEQDLLLQHLRDMYDEVLSMNNTSSTTEKQQVSAQESPVRESLSFQKVMHTNQNLFINETVVQPEIKAPKAEEPVMKQESRPEPSVKTISINERIPSSGSLNQKLKNGSGKEVHKVLSSKPLKELIDLNKKFVLVNELFKGNAESFSKAVSQIDSFGAFEDAEKFISEELSSTHHWDSSSQTTRLFIRLVKQRFGVE